MVKCISCETETEEGVKLPCPKCGKDIYRCAKCRNLAIDYTCKCGFVGP